MISYKSNGECFNFRVAAVLIKEGQVLLHQYEDFDFYAFPGGRAEMFESTEQTIVREMKEELDIQVSVEKLLWVLEDFFVHDGIKFHEIAFYYLVKTGDDLPSEPFERIEIDGSRLTFKWFHLDQITQVDMVPEDLKARLRDLNNHIEHIILDEMRIL